MLQYLVEHAGWLVTREEMLEALWPETYVQPEVLKSYVRDQYQCRDSVTTICSP